MPTSEGVVGAERLVVLMGERYREAWYPGYGFDVHIYYQ